MKGMTMKMKSKLNKNEMKRQIKGYTKEDRQRKAKVEGRNK